MNKTATMTGVYALAILGGGVMGYLMAGSIISLWAGIGSGMAMLAATLAILNRYRWGLNLGRSLSLILGIFFAIKFAMTGKWFPPGIMMLASGLVLAVLLLKSAEGDAEHNRQ